jgi:hypothetical protein
MLKKRQIPLVMLSVLCGLLLAAQPVAAQQTTRAKSVDAVSAETVEVQKKVRKPARALFVDEEAQLRAAIEQCGASCSMGGPGMISAGEQVPADYECENGNCHCFGAQDCVAMSPICAEGTLGCNDQGCICEEG